MKYTFLFLLSYMTVSCTSLNEDGKPTALTAEEELARLLDEVVSFKSMPISSTTGKLKKVKNSISTRDLYYPVDESFQYSVITDSNQDTAMITLVYLSGEKILSSHSISYQDGAAYRWATFEYLYNSENLLNEIYTSNSTKERALLGKYHYDSQSLLVEIAYPYENGEELQVYEYNESGRISSEWKSARGQEDNKIDYLVYRYDNGLLVAKESGIRGTISDQREDAFKYFYNSQGKLILTIEFDPYFGFQQKDKSEYFYYGENN